MEGKTTRAKFTCNTVDKDEYGEFATLYAVTGSDDKDNEENNQFSEATPSGDLSIHVSNPEVFGFFKEGQDYYLDITAVPN